MTGRSVGNGTYRYRLYSPERLLPLFQQKAFGPHRYDFYADCTSNNPAEARKTFIIFEHLDYPGNHTISPDEGMCIPTINTSVFPVDLESQKQRKPKRIISKRRLTFAPEIVQVVGKYISLEDYSREEINDCWWSAKELKDIFAEAKFILRAVHDCGPRRIELLDVSYKRAQQFAKRLDGKGMDALLRDPSESTTELESWTARAAGCRGLEKYCSPFQRAQRIAGSQKMLSALLEIRQAGVSDDEIAAIYAERSRASLIFARLMAAADYKTANRQSRKK
jgi:hypothetical protein